MQNDRKIANINQVPLASGKAIYSHPACRDEDTVSKRAQRRIGCKKKPQRLRFVPERVCGGL
jgi:hypothetical protein